MRFRIGREHFDDVEVGSAIDRVAADADTRGLSQSAAGQLPHGFISERPAARDNPDVASLVNVARGDPNAAAAMGVLAFTRRNNAGAVRTNKPRRFAFQGTF